MEQKQNKTTIPPLQQDIELKNRETITISGVLEVVSATQSLISLKTSLGGLNICGSELKIKNLLENEKKITITGTISEVKYIEKKKKIFEKVFK